MASNFEGTPRIHNKSISDLFYSRIGILPQPYQRSILYADWLSLGDLLALDCLSVALDLSGNSLRAKQAIGFPRDGPTSETGSEGSHTRKRISRYARRAYMALVLWSNHSLRNRCDCARHRRGPRVRPKVAAVKCYQPEPIRLLPPAFEFESRRRNGNAAWKLKDLVEQPIPLFACCLPR
jgi:hypothetical protein